VFYGIGQGLWRHYNCSTLDNQRSRFCKFLRKSVLLVFSLCNCGRFFDQRSHLIFKSQSWVPTLLDETFDSEQQSN